MVSIIVPIYNEEKIILKNLSGFQRLAEQSELIFVDGGSTDRSVEIAKRYGFVIYTEKGRAHQMNYGAGFAKESVLLFLHADTFISTDTLLSIENALRNDGFIGGCLSQRINKDGFIYRLIENFGNIRARLTKVFYGDQAIFVKRDVFLSLGGFPEVPMMEDVLFTKKLRKKGKTRVLSNEVVVSIRRWEKKGIINTVLLYSLINILFWFNVPLNKIKLLYDDLR